MQQQKWIAKLVGFDYEIVYRHRKENNAADALSRKEQPTKLATMSITSPSVGIWDEIAATTVLDSHLGPLIITKSQRWRFNRQAARGSS